MKNIARRLMPLICAIMMIVTCILLAACSGAAGEGGSSGTNNQVASVDEGDLVKVTDDGYIYKAQDDGVTVSKVDSDGSIEVVRSASSLEYKPYELLIFDNYLLSVGNAARKVTVNGRAQYVTGTQITLYDIDAVEDDGLEFELRSIFFYGTFFTSRMYNDAIYVVCNVTDELFGINNAVMSDSVLGQIGFGSVQMSRSKRSGYIIAMLTPETLAGGEAGASFFSGDVLADMYFSEYAAYAITETTRSAGGCFSYYYTVREIVKFSLRTLNVTAKIKNISGTVLGRYALHDSGDYFYFVESSYSHKVNAYDSDLVFISSSKTFGAGERLYAVNFNNLYCYAVTYRTTDPLFKIDIYNPFSMIITGDLKIDDYSTHLQVFGNDLLVGVGYETDARFRPSGLKISLFSVTDSSPREINSLYYGTGSSSLAQTETRAILCEPSLGLFAIPAYTNKTYGVFVFRVGEVIADGADEQEKAEDGTTVLTELGFLTFNSGNDVVKRIARIGGYLYAISDEYIASFSLETLELTNVCSTKLRR